MHGYKGLNYVMFHCITKHGKYDTWWWKEIGRWVSNSLQITPFIFQMAISRKYWFDIITDSFLLQLHFVMSPEISNIAFIMKTGVIDSQNKVGFTLINAKNDMKQR